jgi:hypothetical protein
VHWLVDYIGGKAMHFITENELDNWVDGHAREAQGLIVELILKLVAASSANPRERRFPLGDSIGQHGPDGHLDAIISYEPYIPEGRSFWEIGTGIDAKAKAADDYKSLTEITPESVRKDSTFIFVTPRSGRRDWRHTWKEDGQISWIEEKKQANEWKDVRVIDGTKLVDWVHQFLPIELWLADKIGSLNQNQVETLEKKWELIESFGAPPSLSSALFLANRIDQCSKLSELFNGGNTFRIKLTTHFESEATNFVSAYIASLDEEKKQEALSRAVIVYGEDAWNYLCRNHKNPILVAIEVGLVEEEVRLTRILARVAFVHLIARPALRTLVAVPLHREVNTVFIVRCRCHTIDNNLLLARLLQSRELRASNSFVVAVGSRQYVGVLVLLVYLTALIAIALIVVASTSGEGEHREHHHNNSCIAQRVFKTLFHPLFSFKVPFTLLLFYF